MPNERRYRGSAWRARFLRAPKVAFELEGRPDFVPLGDLADVQLGLKTGADAFFFVKDVPTPVLRELRERRGGRRPPRTVAVEGFNGWRGFIAQADVEPAVLNPHALFDGDVRLLRIPEETGVYYLAPRDQTPADDLAAYIEAGQRADVHRRTLVQNNAANRWYRQSRSTVSARIALPYNSAYDYGAWRNPNGAVLNGRFVGVTPHVDVDIDLLLASLNSTFVIVTRLLEGVATGSEGAFDVGPPAARRMLVPDPRLFTGAAEGVRQIIEELGQSNVMPPAPDSTGQPRDLRRQRLDAAILQALGDSEGEGSHLIGRVYESYARWRRGVEQVEARMRVYRRAMSSTGQARVAPLRHLAERLWSEMADEIRLIPAHVLAHDTMFEVVDVSRQFRAPQQEPLLDGGLVPLDDQSTVDLGSYDRVRYVDMLLRLGHVPPLHVPVDAAIACHIVDAFEHEERELRTRVRERAAEVVSDTALIALTDAVIDQWRRACRESSSRN